MESEPQEEPKKEPKAPREPRDPLSIVLVLIAAAIVVSVSIVGYVLYDNTSGSPLEETPVVASGDSVTMNYIGMFSDGRVFDTSILDVAWDNVLYPKSFTFSQRENDSYVPFEMTAGLYGASGGTIKGFALGVIGMKQNERKIIEVAPEDGYAVDPAMMTDIALEEEIPATETISETDFKSLFNTDPVLMDTVQHYMWQWDVMVVENIGGLITFKHIPTDYDDPQGWACEVESYDPSADGGIGKIVVNHDVSAEDVYKVQGTDSDGLSFVISAFNATAGTFTIHKIDTTSGYNGEIYGRTLYFEVTVLVVKSNA
jgi:FKBP-type peptidyl-prolyl cis-trans isomerase 2